MRGFFTHCGKLMLLLVLSAALCACTRQDDASSLSSAVSGGGEVSSESQPQLSENQPLTAGDFVWLWMKTRDDGGSAGVDFDGAKAKKMIPQSVDRNTPLTVEQAAWLLCGENKDAGQLDVTHYEWQLCDIKDADAQYADALCRAYAEGLIEAPEGKISPSEPVGLSEAQTILARLQDSSRTRPPDCAAPYFEYQGLTEVRRLDSSIIVDLKYATTDNFTGVAHYPLALCLLEADTAKMLVNANAAFHAQGYTVKIWDAYRPVSVQWSLYHAAPPDKKQYAPAPSKYSEHSKGIAVDLTLSATADGAQLKMPTGFDDFTERAHADYAPLPAEELHNRELLKSGMQAQGFEVYSLEWWHYHNPQKAALPISSVELQDFADRQKAFDLRYIAEHSK